MDRLNQLLWEYNNAIGNLKKEERNLLKKQINELNQVMDKGVFNHNWFSLSINAFIKECKSQIEKFNEMKTKVLQTA